MELESTIVEGQCCSVLTREHKKRKGQKGNTGEPKLYPAFRNGGGMWRLRGVSASLCIDRIPTVYTPTALNPWNYGLSKCIDGT